MAWWQEPIAIPRTKPYYANRKKSTSGWFFRRIVNDPENHPLRATLGHQVFYA